jgi:hypothetical protein
MFELEHKYKFGNSSVCPGEVLQAFAQNHIWKGPVVRKMKKT